MGTAEATYAQHAVWFTEQAGVAGTAYHMALGVWFADGLDPAALAAACDAVVARHPVLATRVDDTDGAPRLVPADRLATLSEIDLTEGTFDDAIAAEIARGHDLRAGPLARFLLIAGADGRRLLLVTAHHLVFDGNSKDVLLRDLAAAYGAARAGRPAGRLPTLAGYPARASAERDRVAAESAAAREHWAIHWAGTGGVVLPGATRTPTAAEPGDTLALALAPDLVAGIDQARRKLGVTRFELFLAALHAVLARYGNDQVPVGVGLSTRTAATADEVGLFVNELPVRVTVPDGSFRDHAGAVRAQVRALNAFRSVPLAHVVTGLRPAPALTPVSVGYRRRGPEPVFDQVATTVEWSLFSGAARNALHVQIVDGPHPDGTDTVELSLQYSPAALPADAAARIGGHLLTMLTAVAADPEQPVAELPLLPDDELDLVCRAWSGPDRAGHGDPGHAVSHPEADGTVLALFADQVRRTPDAVAVVDGDRSLSYGELDAVSARLAARLGRHGVEPGTLVAVALERSWQAVAALLAVLRRGAAYVPVDPGHPAARQQMIIDDAAPVLVLTAADGAVRLPAGTPSLTIDSAGLLGSERAETGLAEADPPTTGPEVPGPLPQVSPTHLAYVLYTSGSTGRPKGVAVPHAALTNLVLAMRDQFDSRPQHRWLHLTSLSFDISGVEVYLPLTTGGQVVVASGVNAADGPSVLRLARQAEVTHMQATPSGWRVLLEAGLDDHVVAVTGGEALPVPLARQLRARVDRLINGYGPTEATIYATMAEIPPEPTDVTIGRPVAGTTAYLLDERQRPVPIGVAGELYLGGRGVAAGYLNRPELTAQRFVTDWFAGGGPDARLYRTGDICRWLPDGRIEFLGRVDDQVKIRGHRVELGEITARLLEHPSVAQAAVLLVDSRNNGSGNAGGGNADGGNGDEGNHDEGNHDEDGARLVAYLVARGPAPTVPQLRQHLTLTLPTVMVPAAWMFLDQLPTSPNGKLDRAALPAPPRAAATEDDGNAATTGDGGLDPIVEEIRQIWQDVLQIPDIGVDEDLFDLGGHSLTVTRISSRIHRRLGVEVPLETFFDAPTIAEISEIVREMAAGR